MNPKQILLVALGGAAGSVLRFACQRFFVTLHSGDFPWGTFWVNVSGCYLIGLFFALAAKPSGLTSEWLLLLTTGFCGGFTTFSSFSYENFQLLRQGKLLFFTLYTLGSVTLGLLATLGGYQTLLRK